MRHRKIVIEDYTYVVLNDSGEALHAYVTEGSAMDAAREALVLLGGGVIEHVDGTTERVDATPQAVATA